MLPNKKDEELTISNENLSNKNVERKLDDSQPVLSKSEQSISENDLKDTQDIKINNKIPEIKSKPTQMLKDNALKIMEIHRMILLRHGFYNIVTRYASTLSLIHI